MKRLAMAFAAGLVVLSGTAGFAQVERLQPDFTFKRVGVPAPGQTTGRITVQIDPNAPRRGPVYAEPRVDVAAAPFAVPRPQFGFGWFWDSVPSSVAESSPGRLQLAINRINNPPTGQGIPAPRLQSLQNIAASYGLDILRETVGTQVSPALVLAVISVESAGRIDAVSSAGAQGLMQLMPATASRFGVSDSMHAGQNIKGGVAYLDWLLRRFNNDPVLVLASYNAGEGNVQRHNGVPPFAETLDYVPKVLAAWQVAKGLCRTPPELITDGCVFNVNGI
ncbi:MAG: lytic transglycosylase domain-containing protein [Loktanella sp.]|nr:lytic transglycosylase domain-containing protein [Loktanella sp.]